MSDPLAKRQRAIGPQSTAPPPSISGVTVWVLVRAEYNIDDHVIDSEVVGVYASEALARKAKNIESRHMDSKFERWGDEDEWHGELFHTSLAIYAKMIQDSVHDDDDDDDDDNDDDDDDAVSALP